MKKPELLYLRGLWAVRITNMDGLDRVTVADGNVPKLFYRRREAEAFRKEMAPHLPGYKMRTVRVTVNIEE